ncbi:Lipase [Cladophialophora carrionii]|uniref:Lipase n=1 Tax=Cladophialophora carrionii TaxID=86049 RepID=A0A1C1CW46_9EURO|nr:Lipase [Cladophialophora carrionii]
MDETAGRDGLTRLKELVRKFEPGAEFSELPQNKDYPIVLVPGFSGWGPPLLGAVNYWGGVEDLPRMLQEEGYTVIVATIAPLSSNWERAFRLQAERIASFSTVNPNTGELVEQFDLDVDYGRYFGNDPSTAAVAAQTHARRRAILLPAASWRDLHWTWGDENKAHFICHSQGGNTVRQMIALLKDGANDVHPGYFPENRQGRDEWVISVSTLGTPYQGTTITDVIQDLLSKSGNDTVRLLGRLFATLSFRSPAERAYDLQLDHWDICREAGESFPDMRARLERRGGPVETWLASQRNAFYDNSIEGVEALNDEAKGPSKHICYLTFSFHCTNPFPSWPPWVPAALSSFPISIYDIIRALLRPLPGGDIAMFAIDSIRQGLTSVILWPFFQTLVTFHDFLKWATTHVATRLLEDLDFKLKLLGPGSYVPRKDVFPLMLPTVYAMGGYDPLRNPALSASRREIIRNNSEKWLLNDGIVNTVSMRGPRNEDIIHDVSEANAFPLAKLGRADDRKLVRGKYWHFGVTGYLDHADEIGVWIDSDTGEILKDMYKNLAALVSRIPPA